MKHHYRTLINLKYPADEINVVRHLRRQGIRHISWKLRGRFMYIHIIAHTPQGYMDDILQSVKSLYGPDPVFWLPEVISQHPHLTSPASTQEPLKGVLHRPPGWGLRRFAEFFFSPRTCTLVLEPPLRDLQEDYFVALAENRPGRARMALIRGYWSFWSAISAQLPISLARRCYELWKASKLG